jgi:hypothetical protein
MNKNVRQLCLLLAAAAMVASAAACRHKPAYSDIDANRTATNQNQNSEAQAGTAPAGGESPAPPAAQPPSAPAQAPRHRTPSFIDPVKGDIKDLPNYPGAIRTNVRIGPVQEANVASFVLQTGDSMDQIRSFYERQIKSNHWTVIDKTIDPELCEWRLSRGQDDSAKVELKKDPKTGGITILLVRGEKLEGPDK